MMPIRIFLPWDARAVPQRIIGDNTEAAAMTPDLLIKSFLVIDLLIFVQVNLFKAKINICMGLRIAKIKNWDNIF
jgi:hypothetical protein